MTRFDRRLKIRRLVLCCFVFLALKAELSAQNLVHVLVDVHDPAHDQIDDVVKVRLSRLIADEKVSDVYHGRDLEVPIGKYRIEALVGESHVVSSLTVSLRQPRVQIALGVSLLNCCLHIPGESWLGQLSVTLTADGEPNQYSVRILPIWHSPNSIGVDLGPDWSAEIGPIDLGEYVLVVLRGRQVLLTKHVEIPKENPHVRLNLNLKDHPGK